MTHFEIQPLHRCALPDAATFLSRWFRSGSRGSEANFAQEDSISIERRLNWMLLENPAGRGESRYGFCIRARSGEIRGLNLCFAAQFVAGDKRILGLGSGSFFVEPDARLLGFYLFKKYLSLPGYSFFFTTTSNVNSAPLWQSLGGRAVPGSEREYLFPLNAEALLPALAAEKYSSAIVHKLFSVAGRCVNPFLELSRHSPTALRVTPCRDWCKLAELSGRHRVAGCITAQRSPDFLQWRYENNEGPPSGVYLVRNSRGDEGWFALGEMLRGRRRQIRGTVLLDAVWPRERLSFRELFRAMLQVVDGRTAAVFFRSRRGVELENCPRPLIPLNRGVPSTFVIARKGGPPVPCDSLDLVCADGDTALPLAPRLLGAAVANPRATVALRE